MDNHYGTGKKGLVSPAIAAGYSHPEAFNFMEYTGGRPGCRIFLTIWNSRDGVTPFCYISTEFGIELQHTNWNGDKFNPDHKPKTGELIWVSWTEVAAREQAKQNYIRTRAQLAEMKALSEQELMIKHPHASHYNIIGVLENMLRSRKDFIEHFVNEKVSTHGEPQPRLVLVKEDWK